jgi:hypothetical protein
MKSKIIERLGERDILLPALIAQGLSANDRVKVRLSVLQAAARHARDPAEVRFDMREECRATSLDLVAMETLRQSRGPVGRRTDHSARPRQFASGNLGRHRHHDGGCQIRRRGAG